MEVERLIATISERLGMDVQALSPVPVPDRGRRTPDLWEMLTEHGWLWAVHEAGRLELFRARSRSVSGVVHYVRPSQAVRHFLELHPTRARETERWSPAVD